MKETNTYLQNTGEIVNKRQKREEIGKAIAKLEEELERLEQKELL